jgi:hypothetical protein
MGEGGFLPGFQAQPRLGATARRGSIFSANRERAACRGVVSTDPFGIGVGPFGVGVPPSPRNPEPVPSQIEI